MTALRSTPDRKASAALSGRLRFQADACDRLGSALYESLLNRAADDVEAGGPTWEALRGHERDPGTSALALRLMGAVNRLVLEGRLPDLEACYRDRGADPAATWQAFSAALAGNLELVRQGVDRPVQTNEVGRCAALLPGFLTISAATRLPLRLLEVGASAGLNLRWDHYRYEADGFSWGPRSSPLSIAFELGGNGRLSASPATVSERRGCDASPIDPETDEGRLTLLSYIWADQVRRVERTLAALELARTVPVGLDRGSAAPWVAERLERPVVGEATVAYHSIVTQYLSKGERDAFVGEVEGAGARATEDAPLAWLRMEPAGDRADVALTMWPGGRERRIARAGYHGSPVELPE